MLCYSKLLSSGLFVLFLSFSFTLFSQVPIINNVNPLSGTVGTTVTISGTNFNSGTTANSVHFGAVKATVTAATDTTIVITAPPGATYQPLSVTNANGLTAFSAQPFSTTIAASSSLVATSFPTYTSFATTSSPDGVTPCDLDGDGKNDIICASSSAGFVSILRNISAPGVVAFAPKIDITNLSWSYSIKFIVGDIDGDGKKDLIVLNSNGGNLFVYKNNSTLGTISFATPVQVATTTFSFNPLIADFDGDGKLDIAVQKTSGFSIVRNTTVGGTISFAPRVDITVGSINLSMVVSDLNADGKPDVAVTDYDNNKLYIFANTCSPGTITFASKIDLATGAGGPRFISAGDIDGDGYTDLAITYYSTGNISLYRNTSASSNIAFSRQPDITTTSIPLCISIGNVNGDDKPDIIIGSDSSAALAVFQNTTAGGSISFSPKKEFGIYVKANSVAACDVDNDGKTDLFSGSGSSGLVSVLRYSQNEPFISGFTPITGKLGSTISIFGANFTGTIRVAAGDSAVSSFTVLTDTSITATIGYGATGSITVTNAFGTGSKSGFTYRQPPIIDSFTPLSGAAGSTITISGYGFGNTIQNNIVYFGLVKGSIISATSTQIKVAVPVGAAYAPITIYNGSLTGSSAKYFTPVNLTAPLIAGSFALPTRMANTSNSSQDLLWGDMNNDGKADIVNNGNGLTISRNKSTPGNVLFDSILAFGSGTGFGYPTLADISGDGLPDVIGLSQGTNKMSIFKNASVNGSLAMGFRYEYTTGDSPSYSAAGDVDGDGRLDIAVTNYIANTVSVFLNTTAGGGFVTLAPKVDFATGNNPQRLLMADFDQDGKTDMVVVNGSSISVYKNTSIQGTVSFAPKVDYTTGSGALSIGVADVNSDGYLDIAISDFLLPTIYMFKNVSTNGNLLFNPKVEIATTSNLGGIGFGDMDGDAKPDMLIAMSGPKAIGVFRNTGSSGTISFDTAVSYPVVRGSTSIIAADVDGDGKTDIIADEFGPYYLRNKINEPPVLTSFLPTTAAPGDTLLIRGRNLSGLTSISFGGVTNSFTLLSDTTIRVIFSSGTSGSVMTTTTYGSASLPGFTALSIPVVSSFSPLAGPVGSMVTITGSGFSSILQDNLVSFGPNKAQVVTGSASTLTVLVPKGATGQKIWVTVNGRTGFSALPFQITFAGAITSFLNTYFDTTNRIVVAGEDKVKGLTAFDIDNNGKTDLALGSENSSYDAHFYTYKGTGSGTYLSFAQSANLNANYNPGYPFPVDINGDGKPDIGTANFSDFYPAGVFINQSVLGNLLLSPMANIYCPSLGTSVVTNADFDGDGRPDIVIKSVYNPRIIVCRNTSTLASTSFSTAITIGTVGNLNAEDTQLMAEDFNGDGKPDVAVVANGQLYIFINTGLQGSIGFASPVAFTNGNGKAAAADLDGDGKLDIVQSLNGNGNRMITYLRNISSGNVLAFAPTASITIGAATNGIGGLTVADIDGDAKPDVCINTFFYGSTISILKNTSAPGAVSFLPKVDYPAIRASEIFVGDIDNDGKPDLLTTSLNSNTVCILRNRIGEPLPVQLCPTVASTSIVAGITEANYQWQIDTGTGFANITDNANYAGTNSATLQLINIPSTWYGYKYKCTTTGVNSNVYALQFLDSWRGTVSNDWNNPANWSCGSIPDGNTDVIINSGTVVVTTNAICRTILVKPGATLQIGAVATLTITN